MGLSSSVDWWEEWQLRILVLGSQAVQWILFLSAHRRKSGISVPSRVLIWLAYLGSDAMVIYALAALFNRQRKHYANPSFPHGNSALEAVWAPVLLMHLGGQYCITAYNMEDNELWRRHALIAVSQITVAIYVFCRSWQGGDKRLLQAAIMLFTLGGIRCLEKPFSLQKASISSLASSSDITAQPSGNKGSSTQINSPLDNYVKSLWSLYKAADDLAEAKRAAELAEATRRAAELAEATRRAAELAEATRRAAELAEAKRIADAEAKGVRGVAKASSPSDTAQAEGVAEDSHPSDKAEVEDDIEANLRSVRARAYGDRPSGKAQVGGSVEASSPSDTIQVEGVTKPSRPSDTTRAEASSPSDTAQVEGITEPSRPSDTARAEASRHSDTAPAEYDGETSRHSGKEKREVDSTGHQSATDICSDEQVRDHVNKLFVDLASPYCDRLVVTKDFLSPYGKGPYKKLRKRLSHTFDLLYTKTLPDFEEEESFFVFLAHAFRFACIILPFAAIGLFHRSNREAYDDNDVKVTYTLLCCTAVMEFFSYPPFAGKSKLSGTVVQCSFMGFFARNRKYTRMMSILSDLRCEEYVNQQWPVKSVNSSSKITMLVHQQVKGWWKRHIRNAADYTRFNNNRGQWAIQKAGCSRLLGWSIERSFDESVLLWHIATDLCFHNMGVRSMHSYETAYGCREISNYMMYLLFAKPEMLMAGTRRNLLKVAYKQLNSMLRWEEQPPVDERAIAQKLIAKVEESPNEGHFVHYAWDLAKALLDLKDQKKMWEVIQGVWVEMLCYSASRCRGYLHAQSLGTGGELLTFVWLLWSHMGMETLGEKMQMPGMELKNTHKRRARGSAQVAYVAPCQTQEASGTATVPSCPPTADTLAK